MTQLNLPRLSNAEYDLVERLARQSGTPLDQCPTCKAKEIEIAPGIYSWENGTHAYLGERWPCDCETQMALRKHYLLANIGEQYMRLDWKTYVGPESVTESIDGYLNSWNSMKDNGMGLEIISVSVGVGKTFAATYVGKELVKRGERVRFIDFLPFIGLLNKDDKIRQETEDQLWEATVLILDDVRMPYSTAQGNLFANRFEELIRHRQNFNKVTIMTTNLTTNEMVEFYPRVYSLLSAKQIRVPLPKGADARGGMIGTRNLEQAIVGELAPIT